MNSNSTDKIIYFCYLLAIQHALNSSPFSSLCSILQIRHPLDPATHHNAHYTDSLKHRLNYSSTCW